MLTEDKTVLALMKRIINRLVETTDDHGVELLEALRFELSEAIDCIEENITEWRAGIER